MEAGWHFYGAEEVFHCFDSGEGGFFEICSAGDIEYVCCELGEAFRVYFVDVACPASPDGCEACAVSDIIDSAEFMFQLVACPVTTAGSTSCEAVVREASGPHDFGSGAVVVWFFHEDTGVVNDSLHQGFADTVSDFHGFNVYEIAFHGVHKDVYTATFSLILRESVGEARVQDGEFRSAVICFCTASFFFCFFICNDTGTAHLASGGCNGKDYTDRETGGWGCFFQTEIPDVCFWICDTVADGFGGVDYTSTTDGKNKVYIFFFT